MLRRNLMIAAVAAAAAFMTTAPADATWRVIKWNITGICQIWDFGVDGKPIPFDFHTLTRPLPSFDAAVNAKERLWRAGRCTL